MIIVRSKFAASEIPISRQADFSGCALPLPRLRYTRYNMCLKHNLMGRMPGKQLYHGDWLELYENAFS